MSFSLHSPNLHIWDNAAGSKAWLPLQPISINLSRLLEFDQSKLLAMARESEDTGLQKSGAMAAEGDTESEIEEIEKEILRLSVKLRGLRIKKADKDLRAATSKSFDTKTTFTARKKKDAHFSAGSSISSYNRRGSSHGKSENGGNPGTRFITELCKMKTENANFGSFKPKTLLPDRQNLVAGENSVKNKMVRVVASRYSLRSREQESKRVAIAGACRKEER